MKHKPCIPAKDFWRDRKWIYSHYQDLAKRYPDRWIAVVDREVICAGKDLKKVEEKADKKVGKKEYPLLFIEGGIHVYKD